MLDTILDRRSIRKYTAESVTPEQVRTLLTCAMMAPSAVNKQPWHFVVMTDRAVLNRICAAHPYAGMLRTAPMCIAVCAIEDPALPGYYMQDCSAATMNILLAARELGLGTCWMGVAPRKERMDAVASVLGLPGDVLPFSLIAVGHPAESPARPDRYREDKVHYNRW